jgi:hypothetical protein
MPFASAVRSSVPEFDRGGWGPTNKDLTYSRELQVYALGHPAFNGLEGGDFREWDPLDGRVSDDVFVRPNMLRMRAGGEYRVLLGGTRREHASLAEFRTGGGTGVLCQAQVLRQLDHPAARALLFNLLRYLDGPAWMAEHNEAGLLGDLSAERLAVLTGIGRDRFVELKGKTRNAPGLIIAGDHADVELITQLAAGGSTVLVLSCETSGRLPGYRIERGEDRYYSGTRYGVEDHALFWGFSSASFMPLEQTPVQGAISAVPNGTKVLLGGHCCGHSPTKNDWTADIGFWGLETREAAPPVAVLQLLGKGQIVATTIEPWDTRSETHRQMLTTLLANAGMHIPVESGLVRTIEVKRTVPLTFDGLLDDWTSDMEDINLSEFSHADPVAIRNRDAVAGRVESDRKLSALVYFLHDTEYLYIAGILFSSGEAGFLTADLQGRSITIDPGRKSVKINGMMTPDAKIITGSQPAVDVIDTRLLQVNIIRRGEIEAPQGTTFETAIPWSRLDFEQVPDKMQATFRITGPGGEILQQPVPEEDGINYIVLQIQE